MKNNGIETQDVPESTNFFKAKQSRHDKVKALVFITTICLFIVSCIAVNFGSLIHNPDTIASFQKQAKVSPTSENKTSATSFPLPSSNVFYKCNPHLYKRSKKNENSQISTQAICDLTGYTPISMYDALHVFKNPNKKLGSLENFNEILDPNTVRNKRITQKYYSSSRLEEFKRSSFYVEHTLNITKSRNLVPSTSVKNVSTTNYTLTSTAVFNLNFSASLDTSDTSSDSNVSSKVTANLTTTTLSKDSPPNNTAIEFLTGGKKVYYIHSHNDYLRETPLFDALQRGYKSIEADIWYFSRGSCKYNNASLKEFALSSDSDFDGIESNSPELYVGHSRVNISKYKTLTSLYLKYLKQMLDEINQFYDIQEGASPEEKAGVFFDFPKESLNFILDFKHNGFPTYKLVMKYLQPFIKSNYLTYYDFATNRKVTGPVTIILSGKAPYDVLQTEDAYRSEVQKGRRYVFVDADLTQLSNQTSSINFSRLSALSSANFEEGIKSNQTKWSTYFKEKSFLKGDANKTLDADTVKAASSRFDRAHQLGIKTRIWGIPDYGNDINANINVDLVTQCGMDMMNVDDLDAGIDMWDRINKNK